MKWNILWEDFDDVKIIILENRVSNAARNYTIVCFSRVENGRPTFSPDGSRRPAVVWRAVCSPPPPPRPRPQPLPRCGARSLSTPRLGWPATGGALAYVYGRRARDGGGRLWRWRASRRVVKAFSPVFGRRSASSIVHVVAAAAYDDVPCRVVSYAYAPHTTGRVVREVPPFTGSHLPPASRFCAPLPPTGK